MKNNLPSIFIFIALECEAKIFVKRFQLKKDNTRYPFSIYKNEKMVVTVTGVGKVAMAGAVTYVQALFTEQKMPILLNIGIAGHKTHALGQLLATSKVCDAETGKVFYPALIGRHWPESCEVKSTMVANMHYEDDCLNDMEASAFYEMAIKFTSSELIHCLKVVSDNEGSSITEINPKRVVEWMAEHDAKIEQIVEQLEQLRHLVLPVEIAGYDETIKKWHFTVSGKVKLKALLMQWHVLASTNWLQSQQIEFGNGKDILRQLAGDIKELEVRL